MGKVKSSISSKIASWINPFNKERVVFTTDGKVVFCNPCGKQIACERKSQIEQHVKTGSHNANSLTKPKTSQQLLTTLPEKNKQRKFSEDLCNALVSSGIPFWNLKKEQFRKFLETYTGLNIPDESTIRKLYLPECYKMKMEKIKSELANNFLYLVVDETTDPRGLYVANLLVGVLTSVEPKPAFLIASKQLEKTNHESICKFINDGLKNMDLDEEKVLLLVSDAATYMIKAGKHLKSFYHKLIHITCVAHACNRLAEKIRELYPDVNKLINNGKKMFLKCPSRIRTYREMLGQPLPPVPVITRWNTWLEAAVFYAENFNGFKSVVEKLAEEDDALSVQKIKIVIENSKVKNELTFILAHFKFLIEITKKLEKRNMTLKDSIELIEKVEQNLRDIPGPSGNALREKLKAILEKNTGLTEIKKINSILNGENDEIDAQGIMDPLILSSYKYAPITSVDVERSFSTYKHILSDKRYSFTEQNLEMYIFDNKF